MMSFYWLYWFLQGAYGEAGVSGEPGPKGGKVSIFRSLVAYILHRSYLNYL